MLNLIAARGPVLQPADARAVHPIKPTPAPHLGGPAPAFIAAWECLIFFTLQVFPGRLSDAELAHALFIGASWIADAGHAPASLRAACSTIGLTGSTWLL